MLVVTVYTHDSNAYIIFVSLGSTFPRSACVGYTYLSLVVITGYGLGLYQVCNSWIFLCQVGIHGIELATVCVCVKDLPQVCFGAKELPQVCICGPIRCLYLCDILTSGLYNYVQ